MIREPGWETIVTPFDLKARLVRVASFTPWLREIGEPEAGTLWTETFSPEIPTAHTLTRAVQPLLVQNPGDLTPQLTVLQHASFPKVRRYQPQLPLDVSSADFCQLVTANILDIIRGWRERWTVEDMLRHFQDNYCAAFPEYVRRAVLQDVRRSHGPERWPWIIPGVPGKFVSTQTPLTDAEDSETVQDQLATPEPLQRIAGLQFIQTELTAETLLLLRTAEALPDDSLRVVLQVLLEGGSVQDAATQLNVHHETLRRRIRRFLRRDTA